MESSTVQASDQQTMGSVVGRAAHHHGRLRNSWICSFAIPQRTPRCWPRYRARWRKCIMGLLSVLGFEAGHDHGACTLTPSSI